TVNQCDLILFIYFFYHATATTDIYTLSLHDALPILIGQALVAACRTVDGRPPHSLHCYFLIGGDPKVPIIYEVDRIRDGKSFTTRRVVAIQHGQAIFTLMVSFHNDEPGLEHQVPMPEVPPPEQLPSE